MGSRLGPSLAGVFMRRLEQRYLANCPSQFKPVLYRIYVDDTYCLFGDRSHITMFLEYIYCQHPNINFSTENESENSLAFLGVFVTHEGTNFSTSLYRKKSFTGFYTDFASLSPDKYKTNLISVLVY